MDHFPVSKHKASPASRETSGLSFLAGLPSFAYATIARTRKCCRNDQVGGLATSFCAVLFKIKGVIVC